MTISYRNTGSGTWRRGVVNLGTVNRDFSWKSDHYSLSSSWISDDRPALLDQATVAPGEVGTYTFQITNSGLAAGNYRFDVGLVADGIKWFPASTHAYWDVTVVEPFVADYVTQNAYPTIANGQTQTMTISYRNTGSNTWRRGVVNLGTVNTNYSWKLDGYALASNWISENRPALLNQSTVAPGDVGSYTFQIANPGLGAGNYRLDVGLVADGISWFPANTHAYWDVTVH
jgi:hypothetical protein